jgi:hypothetical protein
MNALPLPPGNVCDIESKELSGYKAQIKKVQIKVLAEIEERQNIVNNFMKNKQELMKANALKQSELSLTPAQMQAMKKDNKHLSQEEKMKLADQIMQQNMNISMQEIQQRQQESKNKDTAALMRYSRAYATEMMAGQTDPDADAAKRIEMNKKKEIAEKLAWIQEKLYRQGLKIQIMMDTLQVDSDTAYSKLLQAEEPYKKEMDRVSEMNRLDPERKNNESAARADFETVNRCLLEIKRLRYQYCFPLTPRYIEILAAMSRYLPTAFNDQDEADRLNNDMLFEQTGVRPPEEAIGLTALKSVEKYITMLLDADKYRIEENPDKENQTQSIGAE